MKLKIILVVQTLGIVFFIMLSTIKAKEAETQKTRAERLSTEAVALIQKAEEQAQKAAEMVKEVKSELQKCMSEK